MRAGIGGGVVLVALLMVAAENLFIFGALSAEVSALRAARSHGPPLEYCVELRAVLSDLEAGLYGSVDDVRPLLNTLRWENDYYLVTHDFPDYVRAQGAVDAVYRDQHEWTCRSILCTAGTGRFSTDRTIEEYAATCGTSHPHAAQRPSSMPSAVRDHSPTWRI